MFSTLAFLALANAEPNTSTKPNPYARQPSCTMSDGVNQRPVGYTGPDIGPNSCNTCECRADNDLVCTTDVCGCTEGCTGGDLCTLYDRSTMVPAGWVGNDASYNSCNVCRCNDDSTLTCTQKICWDGEMIWDPKPGCILSDRVTEVLYGWSDRVEDANGCSECECSEADGLVCTSCTAPPTFSPTATPTASPTGIPTAAPTATPTATPTAIPTAAPTQTCIYVDTKETCKLTPLCRWTGTRCKEVECENMNQSKCKKVLGCSWTDGDCVQVALA